MRIADGKTMCERGLTEFCVDHLRSPWLHHAATARRQNFAMPSFPILTRAARTQWRDRRSFLLLFTLAGLFAIFLLWRYADEILSYSSTRDISQRLREVGQSLWWQIAWLQTVALLLVAPAQAAGSIAHERERGLLENLMLAPLAPARIVGEKWLSSLAPLLLIALVLLPFLLIVVLLGGIGIGALSALLGFQLLLAATSAAIGLACSAWARRAHLALRSAYGLIILWVLGSGAAAFLAGDSVLGSWPGGNLPPFYMTYIGRTNPILGAYDLISPGGLNSGDRWFFVVCTLVIITIFCGWTATRALRKPLVEAPFIERKSATKANNAGAKKTANSAHFEVPVIGELRFSNPVLGREVRSKFRLRQPPIGVIVCEIALALLVAYFYVWMLWTAFTDNSSRDLIFAGVVITGFIVTLISCAVTGANGFSREHESGTWESLRLSMLRPREILAGKFWSIALSCALFSLAFWPLLLPCIEWKNATVAYSGSVTIMQLLAVAIIWACCVVATTLWGLWMGLRTRKSSSASGAALGTGAAWLIVVPTLLLSSGTSVGETWAAMLNPFVALGASTDWRSPGLFTQLGLPFFCVALAFGVLMWRLILAKLRREFGASA